MAKIMINGIEEYARVITSHFLSKFPASSRDESQSPQPRPSSSSSNATAESQSPQARPPPHSPEPPSAVRQSQRINIPDEEPDLEKELRKSLMSLCFLAAIQITIQYRQPQPLPLTASTISLPPIPSGHRILSSPSAATTTGIPFHVSLFALSVTPSSPPTNQHCHPNTSL
ncbi:hypothetical protein OIU85_030206 [Salix viminalis]|uniref:Uncharacterized protein n=1 Tax=Salix viminalis TaxID=40686 RepID=A0A9Q0T8A3_SALVM|nr:hypothetical protein OIU85_030206 [Salix viminalis]